MAGHVPARRREPADDFAIEQSPRLEGSEEASAIRGVHLAEVVDVTMEVVSQPLKETHRALVTLFDQGCDHLKPPSVEPRFHLGDQSGCDAPMLKRRRDGETVDPALAAIVRAEDHHQPSLLLGHDEHSGLVLRFGGHSIPRVPAERSKGQSSLVPELQNALVVVQTETAKNHSFRLIAGSVGAAKTGRLERYWDRRLARHQDRRLPG